MCRLQNTYREADDSASGPQITEWLQSKNPRLRLLGLMSIRRKIESNERLDPNDFFQAQNHIEDPDDDCKWQAFIIIGEFMELDTTSCWHIIMRFGCSPDPDTRTAVATVLLEHFFEINPLLFSVYFDELKNLVHTSATFRHCLSLCRSGWGGADYADMVKKLLA